MFNGPDQLWLKFQTKQRSKEEQRWYNSQMNRDIVADASRGKTTQAQRAVDIPEAGNTRANTADTESRSPQKVKPQWTREQWQEYQHQYGSIIHALFEFDFQCSVICFLSSKMSVLLQRNFEWFIEQFHNEVPKRASANGRRVGWLEQKKQQQAALDPRRMGCLETPAGDGKKCCQGGQSLISRPTFSNAQNLRTCSNFCNSKLNPEFINVCPQSRVQWRRHPTFET